jgi:hypothetical protein
VPDPVVVDTNVIGTANAVEDIDRLPCASRCADALVAVRDGRVLVLDRGQEILQEYHRNAAHSGQPRPGDAFVVWVLTNFANPERCLLVDLSPHPDRVYAEFPDDPELEDFDKDDRKFAAAAIASGVRREVILALDTDWYVVRDALDRHGLDLTFVCPEELDVIAARKGLG